VVISSCSLFTVRESCDQCLHLCRQYVESEVCQQLIDFIFLVYTKKCEFQEFH